MKGSTMLATLEALGIAPSFSRHKSANNPYAEALFRTGKYRPEYRPNPLPVWLKPKPRYYDSSVGITPTISIVAFVS